MLHYRTQPGQLHTTRLDVRVVREGVVLVRASNDTLADSHGTIIPIEPLMRDWLPGFLQHRTISSQHALDLRGIQGQAQIGMARRVDFAPQLEVEVRVDDPATLALIESGRITGASLEFVPLAWEPVLREDGTTHTVFRQFSSQPEHCGLSLVDIPSVPDADILAVRGMLPNWAFAVVDPRVLNGEITDATTMQALRWFPHHDPVTHAVQDNAVEDAIRALDGDITVPDAASLTAEQVKQRARDHLNRHRMPALRANTRGPQRAWEGNMNRWIQARIAQLEAEGVTTADATTQALSEFNALPVDVRARIEQPTAPTQTVRIEVVNLRADEPASDAASAGDAQPPASDAPAVDAAPAQPDDVETRARQIVREELAQLPEAPMGAVAGRFLARADVRAERNLENVLNEVLFRSVVPQMRGAQPTAEQRQEIDNILRHARIDTRALTIEGNGTVIYNELARQFTVRPQPEVVFRNHMRALPMNGTKKQTFPKFDGSSFTFQWNRSSTVGGGSTSAITNSDGTTDTFDIEVTELNGATVLPESFLAFNAQGPSIVQDVILPSLRNAAQREEDKQFFLSDGTHPRPNTFRGLKNIAGVTVVAPGANGDPFTLDVLTAMIRALPNRYRQNPERLAFYVSVRAGDDIGDILAARLTSGGDAWIEKYANVPGPLPVFELRRIPVYAVPALPENETQGTSTDCSTAYLVHRDIPVIGDGLTIRIRPYQMPDFVQRLEVQEFVGLGYQWPDAIVRRAGIRPKA